MLGGCLIFQMIVSSGLLKKRNLNNCRASGFWKLVLDGHELRVVFDEQKHSKHARLVSPILHLSPSFQGHTLSSACRKVSLKLCDLKTYLLLPMSIRQLVSSSPIDPKWRESLQFLILQEFTSLHFQPRSSHISVHTEHNKITPFALPPPPLVREGKI